MRSFALPSERQSLKVDLFHLNGFESYSKFARSGVKYHSLSYWSIVMMSPVEFLTGEFHTMQTGVKSP